MLAPVSLNQSNRIRTSVPINPGPAHTPAISIVTAQHRNQTTPLTNEPTPPTFRSHP